MSNYDANPFAGDSENPFAVCNFMSMSRNVLNLWTRFVAMTFKKRF